MSDPASELKAHLVLEELNRRNRWFGILRGHRRSSPWGKFIPVLLALFALVLIGRSFNFVQAGAILMLTIALLAIEGVHTEGVHRRVDALVGLLQQEGRLQSVLPALHEGKRGDHPGENRMG